ncbi:MAG: hypothetical protein ACOYD4_04100 [Solirubrobacterales bacterium]
MTEADDMTEAEGQLTDKELRAEFDYRFNERLGMMGVKAGETPTPEQSAQARKEAKDAVDILKMARFWRSGQE